MKADETLILGIGNGAGRAVSRVVRRAGVAPRVLVADTDSQSLAEVAGPERLLLGEARLSGRGTGGDPALGRAAAEESLNRLREQVEGMTLAFVVAGLGGGAGAGAAPVALKAARDAGATTVSFVTLPFDFEGRSRRAAAFSSLAGLRLHSDFMVVVPNERLFDAVGEDSVAESFERADDVLARAIDAFWRTLCLPAYVSLDLANLTRMFGRSKGAGTFGYGEGSGPGRAAAAARAAVSSPLLRGGALLRDTPSALVSVVSGPGFSVREVGEVMAIVNEAAGENTETAVGMVVDDDPVSDVTIMILAMDATVDRAGPATPPPRAVRLEPEPSSLPPPSRETARPRKTAGRRHRSQQDKLSYEARARGRFRDAQPTMFDGEDLDVPTYLRRGIAIRKD